MKNFTARLLIVFVLGVMSLSKMKAQEVSFGADLVSSYVWRGTQYANTSIQPEITVSWNGLSLGLWSTSDFTGETFEFDLSLFYEIGNFSFGVTDYYGSYVDDRNPYFKYRRGNGHTFEGTVNYTISEKFPLTLSWNTSFADTDTEFAVEAYPTYISAAYPFSFCNLDFEAEVGMTPWKGEYADGCNVVNIALGINKEIPITEKYALPLYGQVIFNPAANKAFFVFGISF